MKKTLVRKTYNNKLTAYDHCPEQGCGTCCNNITNNNNSGNSGGSNTGGTNNN